MRSWVARCSESLVRYCDLIRKSVDYYLVFEDKIDEEDKNEIEEENKIHLQ